MAKRISLQQKLDFICKHGILKQLTCEEVIDMEKLNETWVDHALRITAIKEYYRRGLMAFTYKTDSEGAAFNNIMQFTNSPKTFIELVYENFEKTPTVSNIPKAQTESAL